MTVRLVYIWRLLPILVIQYVKMMTLLILEYKKSNMGERSIIGGESTESWQNYPLQRECHYYDDIRGAKIER